MTNVLVNDISPRESVLQIEATPANRLFPFSFPLLEAGDLRVAIDDTEQSIDAYSVTGEGSTLNTVEFNIAPPVGSRITMWRDMRVQRVTDFAEGADLRAAVLNDELDRAVMLLQQSELLVGDAVRRQPFDTPIDMALPPAATRAGMYLSFDETGKPEAINARILGDVSNVTQIYGGAHASDPTLRPNGTSLQDGDLYFNTVSKVLMIRSGGAWFSSDVLGTEYLNLDGSRQMSGPLDVGGGAIVNVATVNGRDVEADGTKLDGIEVGATRGDARAVDNTILNAWEIARIDGLTAHAMVNTYIDAFSDANGVEPSSQVIDLVTAGAWELPNSGFTVDADSAGIHLAGISTDRYAYYDYVLTGDFSISFVFRNTDGGRYYPHWGLRKTTDTTDLNTVPWPIDSVHWNSASTLTIINRNRDTVVSTPWSSSSLLPNETVTLTRSGTDVTLQTSAKGIVDTLAYPEDLHFFVGERGGDWPWDFDTLQIQDQSLSMLSVGTAYDAAGDYFSVIDGHAVSKPITASTAPVEVRVFAEIEEVDAATPDTDFFLEASRDNGTTFATATMNRLLDKGSGRAVYAATIDVSAQASPSSVRIRVRAVNAKQLRLHKWGAQADQALSI